MHTNKITFEKDLSKLNSLSVGIVSDTHSYLDPDVHNHINACNVILHAGDIGCAEVIDQLQIISPHVIPVRGNNDVIEKWPSKDHAELGNIHDIAEIKLPGGNVVLLHGDKYNPFATRHEKMRKQFPHAKAVVYGHSHKIFCDQSQSPWILNPGASGKTRTGGGASCMIIDISEQVWKVSTFKKELND